MPDFLLELLSEEIPARMQAKASADLARLFEEQLAAAGLKAEAIETYATPRRLALIARDLPAETEAVSEEIKGPRASAPPQALDGFLRKTGLTRDQLVERDGILFAVIDKPGRKTADVLAEAIPTIVRAFPWPKSMRWGAASSSTESLRWVRPLQGIVALFGDNVVEFEIAGIKSGAATVGHRFHHPGVITIGSANDYAEKLRACHVIIDPAERRRLIAEGAAKAAQAAGLTLVEDDGLLHENAGLTEWPMPLLGAFDPAYLEVPREVIQLTMRTNQKYFALNSSLSRSDGEGDHPEGGGGVTGSASSLAPNFICIANIEASDGGQAIVAGNEKVLAARLSDAKFFWEHDLKIPLEEQAKKLDQIVFHEKLGTVADKVERVAKLARWLVEEGIVGAQDSVRPERSRGAPAQTPHTRPSTTLGTNDVGDLAQMAETAARLAKADLVTGMVGEFPELQGLIGGYLARAQGHPDAIADAIRDHYKPVGQGDEVPTAPVTVAVSLADKLDSLVSFFGQNQVPTGSRDPFALRRSALSLIRLILENNLRAPLWPLITEAAVETSGQLGAEALYAASVSAEEALTARFGSRAADLDIISRIHDFDEAFADEHRATDDYDFARYHVLDFILDRLKVQQREAGVRHDLIDAVFALGGEDDLVRLLARVKALQAFVETPEGADLLAGYKRAANILKKEGWETAEESVRPERSRGALAQTQEERPSTSLGTNEVGELSQKQLSYTPENEEAALIAALDAAEPRARAAVEAEDFEGAMAALASLRAPVDAFFDKVTVNDPERDKRTARLDLLLRMRDAVHRVADFSRIEG